MKSLKRLSIVIVLMLSAQLIGQTGVKISDLNPITASTITDDTLILFGTANLQDTPATPRKLSLADLKQAGDIRKVATVAAMQAVTNAKDNQRFMTDGYSIEGIGANLYRYDAASAATADGGFVITATGMGAGRYIAIDQTVADVTQFGAVGDGVADDTAAVQAAIAAAVSAGRRTVYFPPGDYSVNAGLTVPSSVTIEGSNWRESQLVGTAAVTDMLTLSSFTRVKRLQIICNAATQSAMRTVGGGVVNQVGWIAIEDCYVGGSQFGLTLEDCHNIDVRSCNFAETVQQGVRLAGGANQVTNAVKLDTCSIIGPDIGISATPQVTGLTVLNCTIEQCNGIGIKLVAGYAKRSVVIEGCYFEANGDHDISVEGQNDGVIIEGNSFYNFSGVPPISLDCVSIFQRNAQCKIACNYFNGITAARTFEIEILTARVINTTLIHNGGVRWTTIGGDTVTTARVSDAGTNTLYLPQTEANRTEGQDTIAYAASMGINWGSVSRNNKRIGPLTGTITFPWFSAATPGKYILVLEQDGVGGRTVSWPGINWKGSALQPNAAANSVSVFEFYYDGTTYHEMSVNNS